MFNEEFKNKFLHTIKNDNTKNNLQYMFGITEPFEIELKKDLCLFNGEELLNMFNNYGLSITSSSIESRVSFMRIYFKWAVKEGYNADIDALTYVKKSDYITGMIDKFVFSPKHLNKYLDAAFDKVDLDTTDLIFRGLFWMAFMGVPYKYAENISSKYVDLNDNSLMAGGEYYPMFAESVDVFRRLKTLTQFRFIHPLYKQDTWKDRLDSDILLRGFQRSNSWKNKSTSDKKRHHTIASDATSKLKRAINDGIIKASITYESVRRSGIFYKMFLREQSGIEVNFTTFAMKEYSIDNEDKESQDETCVRASVSKRRKHMTKDYECWKLAMSLSNDNSLR